MKILIECRSIFPKKSAGIENFVYVLAQGLAECYPEDTLYLNIPPNTRLSYYQAINNYRVNFIEDPVIAKYYYFRSKFPFIRYIASLARKIDSTCTRWVEGPRNQWIERCEDMVDIVLYPFQRDTNFHLKKPSVVVMHDFREFEMLGGDPKVINMQISNLHQASAVVTSWPGPFRTLMQLFPNLQQKSFMIPFVFERYPFDGKYLNKNAGSRVLLYPASLAPHKNHENLILALGLLKEQGKQKVKVICTGPQSTTRLSDLQKLALRSGVIDWIEFVGFLERSEIRRLYETVDGVVAPTKYEAFSGAVLEGLQYRKPIACSNIAPLKAFLEMIDAKVCYFNPDDPKEIAIAIEEILEYPTEYYAGAESARRALQRLTPERTARQYHEVFSWLLGASKKPAWSPFEPI